VCSLAFEYMGRNAYGVWVQVAAFGSKFTWANPLATLAVIDPERCVLRSRISVTRPS
jgi:hypothetical protein